MRPVHDEGVGVDDEGEAAGVERRTVHGMLDVKAHDCGTLPPKFKDKRCTLQMHLKLIIPASQLGKTVCDV